MTVEKQISGPRASKQLVNVAPNSSFLVEPGSSSHVERLNSTSQQSHRRLLKSHPTLTAKVHQVPRARVVPLSVDDSKSKSVIRCGKITFRIQW